MELKIVGERALWPPSVAYCMRCTRLTASCRRGLALGASAAPFYEGEKGRRAVWEPFRAVILQQPPEQCQAEPRRVWSQKFGVRSLRKEVQSRRLSALGHNHGTRK